MSAFGKTGEMGEKILIVGSRGRMGSRLLSEAAAEGLQVTGVDIPYDTSLLLKEGKGFTLVIFCVPARYLESSLQEITPFLAPDAVLTDITSVKERPMRQMERNWPGKVVGTHPLFGPGSSRDEDLPVVLVRGHNADATDLARVGKFFERLGCRVFESSAEQHDRAMARIQNMNYITNLAYFAALSGQEDLLPFLTPSFDRRKTAARKMLTEDDEMFRGLFEANGHSHEAVRQFRKMLNVAASGDLEVLGKLAQWWWPDGQK